MMAIAFGLAMEDARGMAVLHLPARLKGEEAARRLVRAARRGGPAPALQLWFRPYWWFRFACELRGLCGRVRERTVDVLVDALNGNTEVCGVAPAGLGQGCPGTAWRAQVDIRRAEELASREALLFVAKTQLLLRSVPRRTIRRALLLFPVWFHPDWGDRAVDGLTGAVLTVAANGTGGIGSVRAVRHRGCQGEAGPYPQAHG